MTIIGRHAPTVALVAATLLGVAFLRHAGAGWPLSLTILAAGAWICVGYLRAGATTRRAADTSETSLG